MSSDGAVARRRPPVKAAEPAPELSGLDLPQLRAYRAALSAEEDKVSYWRRLIQGRVDLLEAQAVSEDTLSITDLVRVLGDTGSGRSRRALLRFPAPAELPDLPDLDDLCEIWEAQLHEAGDDRAAGRIDRLRLTERKLSEYRSALHQRIDAATGELIIRYRADPRAALLLLPQD